MAIQSLAEFQTIFACNPVEVEINVPGTDAFSVFLKPLTSAQRDAFEASVVGVDNKRDMDNLRARLVFNCLVDGTGAPIGNAKQIGAGNARLMQALFKEVQKLNGMEPEAVEEAGKD